MGISNWLRPPRHLLALFAAVTLLPAAALVWLGWQLLDRDRALERHQVQESLDAAAGMVVTAIARDLETTTSAMPGWLTTPPTSLSSGGIIVKIGPRGVTAHAGAPLLFVPVVEDDGADTVASTALWEPAEALEYRERDAAGAARAYRVLDASADPDVRARALIGLARNLRTLGRLDDALATYRTLATLPSARVMDEPADLIARAAECRMLATLGRHDELNTVARTLGIDLTNGRWKIDRGTYEVRMDEVRRWVTLPPDNDGAALAGAIETFWTARYAAATPSSTPTATSGRQTVWTSDRGVLLLWQTAGADVIVFAAGKAYLDQALRGSWNRTLARISLMDADGRTVAGETGDRDERYAVRPHLDTGLPWTVRAASTQALATDAAVAAQRRLLFWGLAVLVFLIPAGGYVVGRAVQKELAVARLQADFVSAVSHEFRTPLTSMAHLTERLQRDATIPDDRRHQYYDVLARDTDRLRRFVETLLDFGRMEAGASQVRLRPTDLAAAVTEIVNEFLADAASGRHAISVSAVGSLPPVRLDRDAFTRAMWNLLDNAAKYSADDAPVAVEIARDGERVAVHVRDRGVGVPPGERDQIFQKFVRGAGTATSGIKGTGVGLAMVDRIIQAHGGEVRLDSVVGEGSTFSLLLPVEEQAAP